MSEAEEAKCSRELMKSGDNAVNAYVLVNWKHVDWHTEWDFTGSLAE
jgi:hypothetical protein